MTGRQFVSNIKSMSKLVTSDALITDRAIFSEGKSSALVLIKQQTDKRKLFQSPNLFTQLTCIEMIPVPLAECCEYTSDRKVSRSKVKLPKIAEGIFGLLIQQVSSVENNVFFKESTPRRYANVLSTHRLPADKFFWMYNNYLYVSSEDIKAVNIFAYFEEDVPAALLFPGDCDCSSDKTPCNNPLDDEFKCPGYLEKAVMDMVRDVLLKNYFNIPQDKTSNNLDEQGK